jgi:periplasmic copper chaperone A
MKRATPTSRGRRCPAIVLWLALVLATTSAQALIVVNQPWVLPAPAGHSTEAYMNLTSTEGATLVAARSDSAAAVTLHSRGSGAGTTAELALPAGAIVELAPGKYRFSLRRLARTVKLGDIVPLTLTIRGTDGVRQNIAVSAVARLRSPVDDERRAHRHRHQEAQH